MQLLLALSLTAATSPVSMQDAPGSATELIVFAGQLRTVKITYTERGSNLGRCEVRVDKDARVIDQMMCSLLANCLAAGWSGIERATKCMNRRIDEVETAAAEGRAAIAGSPFPDEWLAEGYENARRDPTDDVVLVGAEAAVEPGNWVVTEMMVGRNDKGLTRPYMLRWRKCITAAGANQGLARLLEPPPFTANLRLSIPLSCRKWNIKAERGGLVGAMNCETAAGARSSGKLRGKFTTTGMAVHREREWRKPGAWVNATVDTSAVRQGNCSAA